MNALENLVQELQGTVADMTEDCRSSVGTLKNELIEINTKLNLTMCAVGNQPIVAPTRGDFGRAKIPTPKHYTGTREAKELENFLFDMEHISG